MSYSTITPPAVSSTAIAQTIWSYSPRSLTDIQNLISAIQNNNPGAVPSYSDYTYLPVPYYSGQVTTDQLATFVDNAIRNYTMVNVIANISINNPYNLWTTNFVTNLLINPYLTVTSLTMLLSSPYLDGNHAQEILYALAQNYYYNKWIQTITYNAGSTTISTNVTITTSPIFAQSLTISTGVTVTCGLHTCYFITQQFNNYGTIVNYNGGTGGIGGGGGGNGGTGGGGIVVLALTSALGTINVNGTSGANGGGATANAGGGGGGAGILYSITTIGSGGAGGGNGSNANGGAGGGPNGGAGWGAGGGGAITLYTYSNANSMLTFIMQGVSDWWQINVLGKPPSSTTPLYNIYDAGGGGGGAATNPPSVGAGGGGGGGEVIAYAYSFINGSISANGGAGGSGNYAGGGGGGMGGLIFILYGSTSGSFTFSVSGGAGGAGSGGSYNGTAGSTGIATTIQVTVNG